MNISGVVVACRPEHADELIGRIDAFPWADVHHRDPAGRLVITIEAASTDESIARLREVQELPSVIMAEMAEYYLDQEE